jgi:predicted MPP superfamily phosphohydrolase
MAVFTGVASGKSRFNVFQLSTSADWSRAISRPQLHSLEDSMTSSVRNNSSPVQNIDEAYIESTLEEVGRLSERDWYGEIIILMEEKNHPKTGAGSASYYFERKYLAIHVTASIIFL